MEAAGQGAQNAWIVSPTPFHRRMAFFRRDLAGIGAGPFMSSSDFSADPTRAPVTGAAGPLPPGHPQAAELDRLRLLYERGALAGADYWAVRAYILEQAMRTATPVPPAPRDRLFGGVLWAAGFVLVLLAVGGVWKAWDLLARAGGGGGESAVMAGDAGPGSGRVSGAAFGDRRDRGWTFGSGPGSGQGWDWLLGRPGRPPGFENFGPIVRPPFVAPSWHDLDDRRPLRPPPGGREFPRFSPPPGPPGGDWHDADGPGQPPPPPPGGFGSGFGSPPSDGGPGDRDPGGRDMGRPPHP